VSPGQILEFQQWNFPQVIRCRVSPEGFQKGKAAPSGTDLPNALWSSKQKTPSLFLPRLSYVTLKDSTEQTKGHVARLWQLFRSGSVGFEHIFSAFTAASELGRTSNLLKQTYHIFHKPEKEKRPQLKSNHWNGPQFQFQPGIWWHTTLRLCIYFNFCPLPQDFPVTCHCRLSHSCRQLTHKYTCMGDHAPHSCWALWNFARTWAHLS